MRTLRKNQIYLIEFVEKCSFYSRPLQHILYDDGYELANARGQQEAMARNICSTNNLSTSTNSSANCRNRKRPLLSRRRAPRSANRPSDEKSRRASQAQMAAQGLADASAFTPPSLARSAAGPISPATTTALARRRSAEAITAGNQEFLSL
jgi:hypothetical protein